MLCTALYHYSTKKSIMKTALRLFILLLIFYCDINAANAQSSLLLTPDKSFSTGGKMVLSNAANGSPQVASDFAVESNGKLLVVGPFSDNTEQPYIEQYLSDGSPDNSFGTNGFTILHSNTTNYSANATGITLLSGGKILVTMFGDSVLGFNNTLQTLSVARINSNGTIDQTFGTNGFLNFATDNPNGSSPGSISAPQVLVLSDNSLILKYLYNRYDYGANSELDSMFILKAGSNGSLDNQFGTGGKIAIANISGGSNIIAGNNNTIIASGNLYSGGVSYMRYLSNGTPDNSFGSNGVFITTIQSAAGAVVLQSDNSIVAGGVPVIHILSNGTIDNSYNNNTGVNNLVTNNTYTNGAEINGLLSLNNETLFANGIFESIPGTSYSYNYSQLAALFSNGITDTLSLPLIDSFKTVTVKQLNNKIYFLIDSMPVNMPVNTELYEYNISVSPYITQTFTGAKTADSTSLLQWTLSSIQNVKDFQIMRCTDTSTLTGIPNWSIIGTVTAKTGTNYNFTDTFPVNGNNYYRIKVTGTSGAYSYSPNLVLLTYSFPSANCNVPAPYVYEITDTSAELKFNSGGADALYYQYAVIPWNNQFPTPPAGTPIFNTTDTIAHVGGLTASTKYYYYLRAVCKNHGTTDWAAMTFNTLCDTAAIPYTETFTNDASCITNGVWYNDANTGITLYGNSGWFFTKRFYLQAGTTYRVYFQYQMENFVSPAQNKTLMLQMASYPDTLSFVGSPLINLSTAYSSDSFALFTPAESGYYCTGVYGSCTGNDEIYIPEIVVLKNSTSFPCTSNISPANKTTETNFCNNFKLTWRSVPGALSYTLNYYSDNLKRDVDETSLPDTTSNFNLCGDVGDTITWYAIPRIYGENATGCASTSTVFYTPKFSAPANDLCANAQTLTVTKGFCTNSVVGNLMGATFSNTSDTTGICKPQSGNDNADVWYKFIVPSTGNTVIQVSRFNEATSTGTILRAFSGSCGALTPIACAYDNEQYYFNSVEPYRVRLSLTHQTPGSTIYIRVASYLSNGNYFTIGAFDTTSSVTPALVATTNSCTPAVESTIDSLSGKLYMWNALLSSGGQLLGEVNPAGFNLGTVNASLYVNSNAVRMSGGVPYLDRNIQIMPAHSYNPSYINTGIRIYATQAEINACNSAAGDNLLKDYKVINNTDNCGAAFTNTGNDLGYITDSGMYKGTNYYLTARTTTFSSFYFFKGNVTLPLQFVSFTAQVCNNDNVCLNWSTADEVNVSSIVVERSVDGKFFTPLTTVKALGGTSVNNYSDADKQPLNGSNFYRLRSVDKDGRFTYSQTIMIQFAVVSDVQVMPNPANNFATISADHPIKSITLINTQGQVIQKIITNGDFSATVHTVNVAAGLYYLQIETSTGMVIKKLNVIR